MNKWIKKAVFGTCLFTATIVTSLNLSALTIVETTNPDDNFDTVIDNSIVMGITRFEPDVILTALRASDATFNDVIFNFGKDGYKGVKIYYYLSGTWFEMDEKNEAHVINDEAEIQKLNKLDIYYINNKEKILEIPYSKNLDAGYELVFKTNNSKKDKDVKFVDGKILLPATINNVDVYIKNKSSNVEEIVDSFSKNSSNDTVLEKTSHLNLSETIEEKSNNLISTYYNKYSKDDLLTEVDDDVYYVTLGDYVGTENPSELKIGEIAYDNSAKKLSIGNKAFINVPVWKIKDGKVLVALTWLSADALPDKATKVEVGGQTFEVTVYSTSVAGNNVTIVGADGIYGPTGYAHETTINGNTVDFKYTHGTTALGVKLKAGNEEITNESQVIFRKSTDGSMGLTTPEEGYTYAVYFNWENAAISEAKDYVREYKIAIPGKGVISLTLNGHAVPVNVNLSETIEEKSNNLISTYYNKYSKDDLLTEVDDDVYYVTLGDYVGTENPSELKIGEIAYDNSAKKLSIGNKAFINVPVWKIKDGKVLVALTWLSADALPDKATKVEVGGQTFEVTVYSTSVAGNNVTIVGADGIYGPTGYAHETTINGNTVDFKYTHGTTALGVKLKAGNEEITNESQVIFRKSTDGSMGLTTPEEGYTYAVYFNWENAAISEAKDYVREYKIAIPGKGVISLTLNGHAVPSL